MSRRWLVPAALALAALIHLAPLPGVLGAAQLQALYGLANIDAASEFLLRHRALMFALDAALLLAAIARPQLRLTAIVLTLASDIGFLALATTTALSPQLLRVAAFDALSILALTAALVGLTTTRTWRRTPAPAPTR